MKNTIITADSGVITNDSEIPTISLVVIDHETGKEYLDQSDITAAQVYELRAKGHRLTTSCMNISEAKEFFKKQLASFEHVIHLNMSNKISQGSYQVATTAAQELAPDKITVINTKQGGAGGLLIAKKALEKLKITDSIKELVHFIENDLVARTRAEFIVPDPSGYKKSGKGMLNGIINLGLSALSSSQGIPLVKITSSGAMVPFKILKVKDREDMYGEFFASQYDPGQASDQTVAVASLVPEPSRLAKLKERIDAMGLQSIFSNMSAVIATYACRDSLGISYLQNNA